LNPNLTFGFYVLGTPLAATFISAAIIILCLGAFRCWKQQEALVRGKVYAGGWEMVVVMVLSILVSIVLWLLFDIQLI
jgi:uncharacterized membrane protein YidH (DUF202 family)